MEILGNLRLFMHGTSDKATAIIQDFEDLLQWATEYREARRAKVNLMVSLTSIEESRKSIDQATRIKRLTRLAFVFIPLSFVTPVFGMNVKELGTGDAPLCVFFATSVATDFGGNGCLGIDGRQGQGAQLLDLACQETTALLFCCSLSRRKNSSGLQHVVYLDQKFSAAFLSTQSPMSMEMSRLSKDKHPIYNNTSTIPIGQDRRSFGHASARVYQSIESRSTDENFWKCFTRSITQDAACTILRCKNLRL